MNRSDDKIKVKIVATDNVYVLESNSFKVLDFLNDINSNTYALPIVIDNIFYLIPKNNIVKIMIEPHDKLSNFFKLQT